VRSGDPSRQADARPAGKLVNRTFGVPKKRIKRRIAEPAPGMVSRGASLDSERTHIAGSRKEPS